MKTIFKERLLKLADFLDTVPPSRFDFSRWAGNTWKDQNLLDESCGTTACAFGWATAIPEFQALGLHLTRSEDRVVHVSVDKEQASRHWESTLRAANVVFGLDEEQTEWLFIPSETCRSDWDDDEDYGPDGKPFDDASPRSVAEHIRDFVDRDGEPG